MTAKPKPSLFRKLVIGFVLLIVAAMFLVLVIALLGAGGLRITGSG